MKYRVSVAYGYGHCGASSHYETEYMLEASSLNEAQARAKETTVESGTRSNPTEEQIENRCRHCGTPDNGWAPWREILKVEEA